jgi:hypothetical protein
VELALAFVKIGAPIGVEGADAADGVPTGPLAVSATTLQV